MKIYNTIHCNEFSGPKRKMAEQVKHRNIMNEILWIYGVALSLAMMHVILQVNSILTISRHSLVS